LPRTACRHRFRLHPHCDRVAPGDHVGARRAPATTPSGDTALMQDALRNGLVTVAEFVPKLLLFLVILIVGILIAKAVGKALSAILERGWLRPGRGARWGQEGLGQQQV